MIKKIAALVGAAALLAGVAMPVLARHHRHGGSSDVAMVLNGASATSNTGGNTQDNWAEATNGGEAEVEVEEDSGDRTITTGEADADATAVVVANTHIGCDACGRGGRRGQQSHTDVAMVGNGALADANTGDNYQDDMAIADGGSGSEAEVEVEGDSGDRTINTGAADSDADAWVVVNTHLNIGRHHHN